MTNHEISDFQTEVVERSRTVPVLVDFWAEWCAPCRMLGPILERLEEKQKGRWILAKVNTDHHQETATHYGVRGIPNVKLFIDGKVAGEFTGALPERAVEQWLVKVLPNPFQRDLEAAMEMTAKNDIRGARVALEALLAKDGGNEHARALLAGTYLFEEPGRAMDLARTIEEHSEHFPAADAIVTIARLLEKGTHPETLPANAAKGTYMEAIQKLTVNDFDAAVEKFIEVIRQDRKYEDDGARRAVVAIFKILGDTSEIVLKHRRSFSSALYS